MNAPSPPPAPPPRRPARRRTVRRLGRAGRALAAAAAVVLALFAAVAALRARQAERTAFPRVDGTLVVAGLARGVEIHRDARGIPHVEAQSEADAYFGLGFVHAQDRLAQMIWLVRSARGRAAELMGPSALPADRTARTLGIGLAADSEASRLDAATRKALDAYAAGVNAWIAQIERGAAEPPLAFAQARSALEPWKAADSLAIVKLWAWGLAGTLDASLVLADLIELLGGFEAGRYFPQGGLDVHPEARESEAHAAPPARERAPARGGLRGDPLRFAAGLAGRGVGSSAWVVGGRLSASGKPMLAADSHLEATAPALLYEAHVRGGELDVAGGTIPGVPVVWSGRNPALAWGATSAGAVVADLYVESLSDDGRRYHDGERWTPLRERVETILVRGADTETWRVRETRHGPLVNDLVGGEREPLALAWTGARAGDGVGPLLRAARASSAAGFRSLLAEHHEPVLAFVFASSDGTAGLQVAGSVPRRVLATSLAPAPGRTDEYDWRGFVSAAELPQTALAPGAGGWIVAADAPVVRAGALRGEWLVRSGERAGRIEALLREASARGPIALRELAAIQADDLSPRGPELVAQGLALAGDLGGLGAEAREVVAQLRAWDGRTSTDRVGASLYHLFRERLVQEMLARRLPPDLLERYLALPQADPVAVVSRIVAEALAPARRGASPESTAAAEAERAALAEAVRRSLRESWLWLSVHAGPNREKWGWGRFHRLSFRPLGTAALLGDADAGLGPWPCPGDESTIAAAGYDRTSPFAVQVASAYRIAVDAGELDQALTSLVPGQSEHPGHPHRADGVERWLAGRPRLLVTSPLLIEETSRARLVLEPGSAGRRAAEP